MSIDNKDIKQGSGYVRPCPQSLRQTTSRHHLYKEFAVNTRAFFALEILHVMFLNTLQGVGELLGINVSDYFHCLGCLAPRVLSAKAAEHRAPKDTNCCHEGYSQMQGYECALNEGHRDKHFPQCCQVFHHVLAIFGDGLPNNVARNLGITVQHFLTCIEDREVQKRVVDELVQPDLLCDIHKSTCILQFIWNGLEGKRTSS
mmetsp:Transcript_13345/g.35819  ORF Transcript_13345/g.35819 Transcript_13345/m.35819 type:complete len:202 (+) Transcript_13345:1064-1669(+)